MQVHNLIVHRGFHLLQLLHGELKRVFSDFGRCAHFRLSSSASLSLGPAAAGARIAQHDGRNVSFSEVTSFFATRAKARASLLKSSIRPRVQSVAFYSITDY